MPPETNEASEFAELSTAHYLSALSYALRLSRDRDTARDLTQETFERAQKSFPSFATGTNFRAWIYKILFRCHLDRLKRKNNTIPFEHADRVAAPEPAREPEWMRITSEEWISALAELSPKLRDPYVLDARGLTRDQIAEQLNTKRSNVDLLIFRARKLLKEILLRKLPRE